MNTERLRKDYANAVDKVKKCENRIKSINSSIVTLNNQISKLRNDPNKSQKLSRLEKRRDSKFNRKNQLEHALSKLVKARNNINDKLGRDG
jgi:predicted  nucleic acid-binding Zn-ribbon protein